MISQSARWKCGQDVQRTYYKREEHTTARNLFTFTYLSIIIKTKLYQCTVFILIPTKSSRAEQGKMCGSHPVHLFIKGQADI